MSGLREKSREIIKFHVDPQNFTLLLAMFALSSLIWWPLTRVTPGLGTLVGLLLFLFAVATIFLSYQSGGTGTQTRISSAKITKFRLASFFRKPEAWLFLLLAWISIISSLKLTSFTARDLPIYFLFVLTFFAMKNFKFEKRGDTLSFFLLLIIIGVLIAGALRTAEVSELLVEGSRPLSIN